MDSTPKRSQQRRLSTITVKSKARLAGVENGVDVECTRRPATGCGIDGVGGVGVSTVKWAAQSHAQVAPSSIAENPPLPPPRRASLFGWLAAVAFDSPSVNAVADTPSQTQQSPPVAVTRTRGRGRGSVSTFVRRMSTFASAVVSPVRRNSQRTPSVAPASSDPSTHTRTSPDGIPAGSDDDPVTKGASLPVGDQMTDFESEEMRGVRSKLQEAPTIVKILRQFWEICCEHHAHMERSFIDGGGSVLAAAAAATAEAESCMKSALSDCAVERLEMEWIDYMDYHLSIFCHLTEIKTDTVLDADQKAEAWAAGLEDWSSDVAHQGDTKLSYQAFADSVFELVDLHTTTVSEQDYGAWLSELVAGITVSNDDRSFGSSTRIRRFVRSWPRPETNVNVCDVAFAALQAQLGIKTGKPSGGFGNIGPPSRTARHSTNSVSPSTPSVGRAHAGDDGRPTTAPAMVGQPHSSTLSADGPRPSTPAAPEGHVTTVSKAAEGKQQKENTRIMQQAWLQWREEGEAHVTFDGFANASEVRKAISIAMTELPSECISEFDLTVMLFNRVKENNGHVLTLEDMQRTMIKRIDFLAMPKRRSSLRERLAKASTTASFSMRSAVSFHNNEESSFGNHRQPDGNHTSNKKNTTVTKILKTWRG